MTESQLRRLSAEAKEQGLELRQDDEGTWLKSTDEPDAWVGPFDGLEGVEKYLLQDDVQTRPAPRPRR